MLSVKSIIPACAYSWFKITAFKASVNVDLIMEALSVKQTARLNKEKLVMGDNLSTRLFTIFS